MPTTIAQFINGTDPLREFDIPLFEIKDIPGKGKGLVTRLDISSGTRILCEKLLLTIPSKLYEELEALLAEKPKAMSRASQRQFLSFHNNFPGSIHQRYRQDESMERDLLSRSIDSTGSWMPRKTLMNVFPISPTRTRIHA